MALATSGAAGAPSVRMVLLKGVDTEGFVFYTNYGSRKAGELEGPSRKAALAFYWPELERQVRVEGGGGEDECGGVGCVFRQPAGPRAGSVRRLLHKDRPVPSREYLEERDARTRGAVSEWERAAAAGLGWIPRDSSSHRVLAGPAEPVA